MAFSAFVVLLPPNLARADHAFQASDMFDLSIGNAVAGAGTLTGTGDEVWLTVGAPGLDNSTADTLWWVVFDNPQKGSSRCFRCV